MSAWRVSILVFLCGCAQPLMRVQERPEGASLLVNGRFRAEGEALAGWEGWTDGYEVGEGRQGEGVYCRNPRPLQRGIGQRLVLDQEQPAPLLVSGWSRARQVSGGRSSEYSLYVDLIYDDGEEVWGQHAPFDTGTHGWQERRLLIRPRKPIRELSVYALFRGVTGEAWFDDFAVHSVGGGEMTVFDGVPVARGEWKGGGGEKRRFTTGDGLALEFAGGTERVSRVRIDGEMLPGDGPSGFMARDAAAGSDFFGFAQGGCEPLKLRLEVEVEERGNHLRISGKVASQVEKDRAISLVFALPVAADGWRWHEEMRGSRMIEGKREYVNAAHIGTGATGDMALYPWALIENGEVGLMLAVDPDRPAQYRLGYSGGTGQYFIAYDFGLVPEREAGPNRAEFAFVVARTDPEWGFRAAAERYYRIFADAFLRRSSRQGIWMPFTDVSRVEGWEDFGFRYHEGINNIPFDDEADILSFRYTEPSTWWMRMPPQVPRTHAGVMQVLHEKVAEGDRRARAIEISGSHDEQGRLQYQIRREPWCDGAVFSSNPSPYLPGDSAAEMRWNRREIERRYGEGAPGVQDGEYLDSVEGYVTATENFRREHFRHARVPLTFSTASKRPVINKGFSVWEFATWMAGQVRGMGKLMFGNAVPDRYAFLAPAFDVMGTETNWLAGDQWRPPADAWFNFRRAMCYQKPYLLLMNTDYDRLTPERVEQYFQRCLFYGFFPSMFSHNAAENPYWETPRWYERDRELFKRYIPLIRRVAEAGWEPVTGARVEDSEIRVERFGPAEGRVYITLFNGAGEGRTARLILEKGIAGEVERIEELTGGDSLDFRREGERTAVEIEIGAEEVRVLAIALRE